MTINFKKKIGNLELCPNTYIGDKESDGLEICQWAEDSSHKWTIASFIYDKKEKTFYIKECCDRLDDININWTAFGYLVTLGRQYLKTMLALEQHKDNTSTKGNLKMFKNCNFDLDIDVKDIDTKNLTDFKKCFDNYSELIPIKNLEQIIEELWDKEPNIEKLSPEEVINICTEKGWKLNLYNIIKIYEDCKKDKITLKD